MSLLLHGYVVAKGRVSVKDDPRSKHNRGAIDKIIRLGNNINAVPKSILKGPFSFGNLLHAPELSVLRDIWFEKDTDARPQMKLMLDKMRRESEHVQGTIVVENIDVLVSHADNQTLDEAKIITTILKRPVSIIDLSTETATKLIAIDPSYITKEIMFDLITDSAKNRFRLESKVAGVAKSQKKILSPVEPPRFDFHPNYDLLGDHNYRPVKQNPEKP